MKSKSASFRQYTFSLFTACVYRLVDDDSLVKLLVAVVSESSDYFRIAALTCTDIVMQEVERRISFSEDILWSDGCASQLFQILANYRSNLIIEYHNNKAHHDKDPLDGIGGTIKSVVFRQMESGKVITNSPKEFCDAANRFVFSIFMLSQKEKKSCYASLIALTNHPLFLQP